MRADYRAPRLCQHLAPKPIGSGYSLRHSGNSSFILSAPSAVGRKVLFFCSGGPAEGFVSFPGLVSIHVFPYMSGGGYCSILLSS